VPAGGGKEKLEGAFCVWTAAEVRQLLGTEAVEGASKHGTTAAAIFMHHYGVKEQGNVDPNQVRTQEGVGLQGSNVYNEGR